eukprot:3058190-Rhodomonas_salina.1
MSSCVFPRRDSSVLSAWSLSICLTRSSGGGQASVCCGQTVPASASGRAPPAPAAAQTRPAPLRAAGASASARGVRRRRRSAARPSSPRPPLQAAAPPQYSWRCGRSRRAAWGRP